MLLDAAAAAGAALLLVEVCDEVDRELAEWGQAVTGWDVKEDNAIISVRSTRSSRSAQDPAQENISVSALFFI